MGNSVKHHWLSGLVNTGIRLLGPYRLWRLFHAWAENHPREAQACLEYLFRAELPRKWLSADFLAYWLRCDETVAIMRHQSVQLDSPFYALLVFRQVLHESLAQKHIPNRVLEIGPGVHLGAAFCFAAMGVERVVVADIARIQPDPKFYEQLQDLLAVAGGFRWWRYNPVVNKYKELSYPDFADHVSPTEILKRVEIASPVSAESLPFEAEAFDLVYSVNAFEHFPRPREAVAETARVLKPGGLAVCEIDLRYHCDMNKHGPDEALKFLQWTEEQWRGMSETYAEDRALRGCLKGEWGREVYCNRIRWPEWMRLFSEVGFDIQKGEPVEVLDPNTIRRETFVEPFRSMSPADLSVLVGRIVARKR